MEENGCKNFEKKIISLIDAYTLCFSLVSPSEAQKLEENKKRMHDVLKNPEYEGIKDIISMIKTYDLLYDTAVFPPGERNNTDELVRYLLSLIPSRVETRTKRKRNINTLGESFIRNKFGIPLFGPLRPPSLPKEGGIILTWASSNEDESILIAAAELTKETRMYYEGLGVQVESQAPWMLMQLINNSKGSGVRVRDPRLSGADNFSFSRYDLLISREAEICQEMSALFDPLDNRYLYYFFQEESLKKKMLKYLSRSLSGSFGIPLRDSEDKAQFFIQKIL